MTDTEYVGLVTRLREDDWPSPIPLVECPCCGGHAQMMPDVPAGQPVPTAVVDDGSTKWSVLCDNFVRCRMGQYGGWTDPGKAAEAWNRRALSAEHKVTALEARVGELEAALTPLAVLELPRYRPVGNCSFYNIRFDDIERARAATSGGTDGE